MTQATLDTVNDPVGDSLAREVDPVHSATNIDAGFAVAVPDSSVRIACSIAHFKQPEREEDIQCTTQRPIL